MKKRLIIIGAGGAGREVAQIATDISSCNKTDWILHGFLDDSDMLQGKSVNNIPVIGTIKEWNPNKDEVFVCSIANSHTRKIVSELLEKKGALFISLIHPTVVVSSTALYGKGLIVYPFSVLSTNVTIGNHVIINMHNAIGHDARIGDFSVLSSFCDITGYVTIGEMVFLGSHVTIAPKLRIGNCATLGMGSVVVTSIKENKTVFGNPAKAMVI